MSNFCSARSCWRVPNASDVVLFRSRYNWEFIPHTHEAATVLMVTDGVVEVGVGANRYIAQKGQLAIIGANQVHSARPMVASGWEMRSLHLPPSEIARATSLQLEQCKRMHFTNPVHSIDSLGSMFLELHRCTETMDADADDLHAFVQRLFAKIEIFGPTISDVALPDERVVKAMNIMTERVGDTIQISEIAAEVGLSAFALIRRFERAFGISPHRWRIQARANEAARLLRGRTHAASAAALCGFSDQSHMVRVFKKVFGITPGQYCM
jgi:AraC-like DNA-binding protein